MALFTGIYASAIGLGSTISAALAGPLAVASGGWRIGAGIFTLPGFIAIGAWMVIARAERRAGTVKPGTVAPQKGSSLPFTNRLAWLAASYFAQNNFLFFALIAWTAPMYMERGMSGTDAALLLASFTAAFMVANPLAGFISRNNDRRRLIALFASTSLFGILAIGLTPPMPYLFIPLIALGVGGCKRSELLDSLCSGHWLLRRRLGSILAWRGARQHRGVHCSILDAGYRRSSQAVTSPAASPRPHLAGGKQQSPCSRPKPSGYPPLFGL